jgi:hypothetical protein
MHAGLEAVTDARGDVRWASCLPSRQTGDSKAFQQSFNPPEWVGSEEYEYRSRAGGLIFWQILRFTGLPKNSLRSILEVEKQ